MSDLHPRNKPFVGVSACLNGEAVRYDGNDKQHHLISDILPRFVRLQPFCPEVSAQLGVPRPPVQLVATSTGIRALGVEDPHSDVTARLQDVSEAYWRSDSARHLTGYIFKSRSPSCGLGSTPVHANGQPTATHTSGLFAAQALQAQSVRVTSTEFPLPGLLLLEEEWFSSAARCYRFVTACYCAAGLLSTTLEKTLRSLLIDDKKEKNGTASIATLVNTLLSQNDEAAQDERLREFCNRYLAQSD